MKVEVRVKVDFNRKKIGKPWKIVRKFVFFLLNEEKNKWKTNFETLLKKNLSDNDQSISYFNHHSSLSIITPGNMQQVIVSIRI